MNYTLQLRNCGGSMLHPNYKRKRGNHPDASIYLKEGAFGCSVRAGAQSFLGDSGQRSSGLEMVRFQGIISS